MMASTFAGSASMLLSSAIFCSSSASSRLSCSTSREVSRDQTHVEYGVGLLVGEVERGHQTLAGLVPVAARLDYLHDLVDVGERLIQTRQYVSRSSCLFQVALGAARGDLFLVLEVVDQHLFEVDYLRLAVYEREEDDAVGTPGGWCVCISVLSTT